MELTQPHQLVTYLTKYYDVTETAAKEMVERHHEKIVQAINIASFVHYVGDQIAEAEDLEPLDEPDDEEIAYDADEE